MGDRIEIRMFGRLLVRRADGSLVDSDEWSTGKTADLLRLLALNANRQGSVSSLLDKLWPEVDDLKARASLRTAASRIRRALGSDCVDRHLGGLVLRGVWVDVVAFQMVLHEARSAMHAREYARVVALAREAESLYVADFHAYDDKSTWAIETRESLRIGRQTLLADAAESAVHLLWMRDAIDLATLAISEDGCFERAHRALMAAHAGLGEVELALRAFEHCRFNLSQELGADPSPQTRALHIQIISGDIEEISLTPFTGRDGEVQDLAEVIRASIAGNGCDIVCLTGPEGSGRGALLQAAVARVPHAHLRRLIADSPSSSVHFRLASLMSDRRSDITVWSSADGDPAWEASRFASFLSGLDPGEPRVVAIVTSDASGDLLEAEMRKSPYSLHRRTTGAISDSDLSALASAALSGPATPRLLQELREQSEGMAGSAMSILREWLASGWIIATSSGLDLYNDAEAVTGISPVSDQFRQLLEQLTPEELEFCQLLAVANRPVTAETVPRLWSESHDQPISNDTVQFQLDELADLSVLRVGADGYEFRNLAIRDSFESWMRPTARARLLRSVGRAFPDEHSVPSPGL